MNSTGSSKSSMRSSSDNPLPVPALAITLLLWAVCWTCARLALGYYGRGADTRKSRLALHFFLLFHEPIHALVCTKRHIDGIRREIRTRRGMSRHTPVH